jgi:hypothetical protein
MDQLMLRHALLLCVSGYVLSGCAGMSEQACVSADWRTVGFEDGTLGRSPATIGNYRQACSNHGVTPDLDAYRAGHAEGVEIYCRASHGFEVGHSGATYQGVCPDPLEADFVAEYNAGRHLFELEAALRNVDARIAGNHRTQENIKKELASIAATMVATDTTPEARVKLVTRSAELGRRYGELTTQTQQLERERAVHERDLFDYQQTLAAR